MPVAAHQIGGTPQPGRDGCDAVTSRARKMETSDARSCAGDVHLGSAGAIIAWAAEILGGGAAGARLTFTATAAATTAAAAAPAASRPRRRRIRRPWAMAI